MEYTYAEPLQAGDTIAVVAPSSALAGDDVIKGLTFLRSLGYEVKIGKSVSAFDGYLAGPDRLRARDINEAFADDGSLRDARLEKTLGEVVGALLTAFKPA